VWSVDTEKAEESINVGRLDPHFERDRVVGKDVIGPQPAGALPEGDRAGLIAYAFRIGVSGRPSMKAVGIEQWAGSSRRLGMRRPGGHHDEREERCSNVPHGFARADGMLRSTAVAVKRKPSAGRATIAFP